MRIQDNYVLATIIGTILSVWGVFLPWGDKIYFAYYSGLTFFFGVELVLGDFALLGCIIMSLFLVSYVKRGREYLLIPVLLGSFIAVFSVLLWILDPKANVAYLHLYPPYGIVTVPVTKQYYNIRVTFGAYMSLIGAILVSGSIFGKWIFRKSDCD